MNYTANIRTPEGTLITLNEYYDRPEWKATAKEARRMAGYRCEHCSRDNVCLHVHHLHYNSLWAEQPEDVEVLCPPCHETADECRRREKGIDTFMTKKHKTPHWEHHYTWSEAETEFDSWLEWKEANG